jgi:lysophospholipase L1-like esterase
MPLALMLLGVFAGISSAAPVVWDTRQARPDVPRVMPLGDSITFGDGSSHGAGYRGDLWHALADVGYDVDFVGSEQDGTFPDPDHEGHPGWEIDDITDQVVRWLTRWRPTVVLLHIGTNDLDRDADVKRAPARLATLVDTILRTMPTVTLYVASVAPVRSAVVQRRIDAFNVEVPRLVAARASAGYKIHFVDVAAELTTADLFDELHPNDRGYAKMAGVWFDALTSGTRSSSTPKIVR